MTLVSLTATEHSRSVHDDGDLHLQRLNRSLREGGSGHEHDHGIGASFSSFRALLQLRQHPKDANGTLGAGNRLCTAEQVREVESSRKELDGTSER